MRGGVAGRAVRGRAKAVGEAMGSGRKPGGSRAADGDGQRPEAGRQPGGRPRRVAARTRGRRAAGIDSEEGPCAGL